MKAPNETSSSTSPLLEFTPTPEGQLEIRIPEVITEDWLKAFDTEFGRADVGITLSVEDWLAQRYDKDHRLPVGSAYYTLEDQMSMSGWNQTLTGKIWSANMTHTPQYIYDTGEAKPVVAMIDAAMVLPGDKKHPIFNDDDGITKLILVRLDRVQDNTAIIER